MPIVTLTTDLGSEDYYLATIKAKLLSQDADIQVIDITHQIEAHNVPEAAFVLKNILPHFPKNSIHIIGVAAGSLDKEIHLGIHYKGQYILCADIGLFSLIAEQHPDLVVELTMNIDTDNINFPARDLYAPAAIHLARGGTLEVIGRRTEFTNKKLNWQPLFGDDYIKGSIIHVDHYGNAISNITKEDIHKTGKGREFLIGFKHRGYEIESFSLRYSDVEYGQRLAILNSAGLVEISINQGHASNLLGLVIGDPIIMTFG